MVKFIKICVYSIIFIVIFVGGITLISYLNRYEAMDINEKVKLIESGEAIRGGETSQSAVINEETALDNKTKKRNNIRLSDSNPLDPVQFLFASLALEDIDQFIFSFNVETILFEYQSLDDTAKEQILSSMKQISRENTIDSIQYNELKNNQIELKILYEDGKEAEITLQLDRTTSINYELEPVFYNILTPISEIIEQIENTIQ
ncbi:hypothetical protein [Oceanobacillus luteolus]|uniref:Uncharacterized protein n=1 Tax=Oceanobacillus luteolus TaxID=1274358 RepID=A0ABW4HX84_9BACI